MAIAPNPAKQAANPRVAKLIELETRGVIKPEHLQELNTYRSQGVAPVSAGASATEGERKASAFLSRAMGSNSSYEAVDVGPRSLIGQGMADNVPNVLNSMPGFIGNSDDRQVSDSAQDEFIAASLRQDSGAAIPPEEMARQRRIYFPMPGDEAPALAQKRQARLRALDGLFQSAGRSVTPMQREEFEKIKADVDAALKGEAAPTSETTPGANMESVAAIDAPATALDVATGVRGGPLEVDVTDSAISPQTPEFRAGLRALLNDPKTTKDQILEYWDKNAPGALEKGANPRPAPLATERGEDGIVENVDAAVRGTADTLTLGLATRGAALADTVSNGGTYRENLDRQRGVDEYDAEINPWTRGAGQLAGAFGIPSRALAARGAAESGAIAKGMGIGEARLEARKAFAKRLGAEGATVGGAYGFNSEYGDWDEKVGAGVRAGVTGGALGYGLGRMFGIEAPDLPSGPSASPGPVVPSGGLGPTATRLGITPTPATTGGNVAAGTQRTLGNLPGSAGPIRNAVEAETEALGDAARRTAETMGPVSTPAGAGGVIARGARVADKKAVREAGKVYDARTEMMGGDASPVLMGTTAKSIANIKRDFPSNPVLGELLQHPVVTKLGKIAGKADAELTLDEATSLLSEVRRLKNKAVSGPSGSQPKEFKDNLRAIEQAVEDDVMNAAQASDAIAGRAAGTGAAAAQTKGDKLYAEAMRSRDRELSTALGSVADDVKVPAERVYGQLFNAMNEKGGNLSLLKKSFAKLPEKARATFAASAFDDLGRAIDSAQNARADAWSFQTFATNWAKKSDEAKRLVFGGRGVDREIDDIVRYAERLRQIDKSRNFSNTSPNQLAGGTGIAFMTALMTGSVKTAAGIGATYGALNGVARTFLAVPAMRQWMRSALHATVKGVTGNKGADANLKVLIRRLPALAARNPQIANEVGKLEAALIRGVNDNVPLSAAASDQEKKADGRNR